MMSDNIRNCGCGSRNGITPKGMMSRFKIWQCEEHGFFCPFDGWQFKTIDKLKEHIERGQLRSENHLCEGFWRHGLEALDEVLFEIKYYKLREKLQKTRQEAIELFANRLTERISGFAKRIYTSKMAWEIEQVKKDVKNDG